MNLTKIDWCAYRSKTHVGQLLSDIESVFDVQDSFTATASGHGWNGYESAITLQLLGKRVGFVATGGQHQKGWSQVNLTGDAMPHIKNPSERLTGIVEACNGQFKRVDIALTTSDGSVNAHKVLQAHRSGGFDITNRRPTCKAIVPETIQDGTTVYIGKRTQPKYLRAYDKGYQLLAEWNNALAPGEQPYTVEDLQIDGCLLSNLFRVELEIKLPPQDFPTDILERSDSYFSGAYPYLATLVAARPETFCLTPQRAAQLTLDQALGHIRRQWGNTLFTALAVHGGDFLPVWDKIVGKEHSQSLIERGVMFAELS